MVALLPSPSRARACEHPQMTLCVNAAGCYFSGAAAMTFPAWASQTTLIPTLKTGCQG